MEAHVTEELFCISTAVTVRARQGFFKFSKIYGTPLVFSILLQNQKNMVFQFLSKREVVYYK